MSGSGDRVLGSALCRFFAGAQACAGGDPEGVFEMGAAIADFDEGQVIMRLPLYLGMLAEGLLEHFSIDAAETVTAIALGWIDRFGERWCLPEILRIKGLILLHRDETGAAERILVKSLHVAKEMGARAWQLRTATTLGGLWLDSARSDDAAKLLCPIRQTFANDGITADLELADALLKRLTRAPGDLRGPGRPKARATLNPALGE